MLNGAEMEMDKKGLDCNHLTFFPALHESFHSEDFLELCVERQIILQEFVENEKVGKIFYLERWCFRQWIRCGGLSVPLSLGESRWIQTTVNIITICFLKAVTIFQPLYELLYRLILEEHLTLTLWMNKKIGCETKVFLYLGDSIVWICLRHGKLLDAKISCLASPPLLTLRAVPGSNLFITSGRLSTLYRLLVQWCLNLFLLNSRKCLLPSLTCIFLFCLPISIGQIPSS